MNLSTSLALSMASPHTRTPSENSSLRTVTGPRRTNSCRSNRISVYTGKSERPLGWKPRRTRKRISVGSVDSITKQIKMKKFNGTERTSNEWDGLRKDPELFYPAADCLVHLYDYGQSKRGPAFKVPSAVLRIKHCYPLLERFMLRHEAISPYSDVNSEDEWYTENYDSTPLELYVPAPLDVARGEAYLYHVATRNFFAWVFGKSLVGIHLGGALVGLLNSMNEFRGEAEDNVEAIMDYMDEEGYGDIRNQPDHALGVLFFAEHFQFRDLYIDAFTHCVGMCERLHQSPGFEYISDRSRALITRSRLEMEVRMDHCGRILGSFLSDDLSEAHIGLPDGARIHLDKFRSFLHAHYIAKFGFYPPVSSASGYAAFPVSTLKQMSADFLKLYEYLVDSSFMDGDRVPAHHEAGINVMQCLQAFDERHNYDPLVCPLPLLPEVEEPAPKPRMNRRITWFPKGDKMKPDLRLKAFAALSKATNNKDHTLLESSLVRAYRGFESDCVFATRKTDKIDKLSQTDARKVRWILICATLQTLISATRVPDEVRDTQNVSYNISVLTANCPPWKEFQPIEDLLRTQTAHAQEDFKTSSHSLSTTSQSTLVSPIIHNPFLELKPEIDHTSLVQNSQEPSSPTRSSSEASPTSSPTRKSTVRKALSTLGNMPALQHPKPKRASHHEILVEGYGNGTNNISITSGSTKSMAESTNSSFSSVSGDDASVEDWRWSHNSNADDSESLPSSVSTDSRRGSSASEKGAIENFAGNAETAGEDIFLWGNGNSYREPASVAPLNVKKGGLVAEDEMRVTTEVMISYEDDTDTRSIEHLFLH